MSDFGLDPLAVHAFRRQNQYQFVVTANRFVNLFVTFAPALNVVWCKPTPHVFALKVGIQLVGEFLVSGRVASLITAKAANGYHFKTGRSTSVRDRFLYSIGVN